MSTDVTKLFELAANLNQNEREALIWKLLENEKHSYSNYFHQIKIADRLVFLIELPENYQTETTTSYTKPIKRALGGLEGKIWMSPDFDEPLDDFKEYM